MTHSSLRRLGVWSFLLICFSWSWLSLLIARLFHVSLDNPAAQLLTMALVPALSAIIVRAWITQEGFRDAGLRLNLRAHWPSYVVAVVVPILVFATALGIGLATGLWDPSLGVDTQAVLITVASGPLVALAASPIFLGEEFGWTAYLRDRLVPQRPLATTFATGTIWGIWHFPLPWVGYFAGVPHRGTVGKKWLRVDGSDTACGV